MKSKKKIEETEVKVEETEVKIEDVDETVQESSETAALYGTVDAPIGVNIRKEPSLSAPISAVVQPGDKLIINDDLSTAEFYNVCLMTGVVGYIVKQYVKR